MPEVERLRAGHRQRNLSSCDRRIRTVLAVALTVVAIALLARGSANGVALLIIAAAVAATAASARCPLYRLYGFSTLTGGSAGCCSGPEGTCRR
jgi:hypothetical protein